MVLSESLAALLALLLLAATPMAAMPAAHFQAAQPENAAAPADRQSEAGNVGEEVEKKVKEIDKPSLQVLGEAEIPNLPPEGNKKNAGLAAKLVNGTVVAPGAVFSFNQVVGPRTRARGFVVGLSVVKTPRGSRFVPDVGGGICRTSTAIHQAVLKAGLQPLERHSHSMPVEYAEPGEDAAIVWGRWDYKFKNTANVPVKLLLDADSEKITAQIVAVPTK